MPRNTIHKTYKLNVVGFTWGGFESAYEYSVDAAPKTLADAKKFAGDFQSLSDFQVVQTTRGGDWFHEWTRRKIVRDWKQSESEEKFMAVQS